MLIKNPTTQASLQWVASLPSQSHINSRAFLDHTVNFSDNSVSPEIMKKEVALVPRFINGGHLLLRVYVGSDIIIVLH